MSLIHALVLGITQGLSEYLPISSSGHLRLVPWLLLLSAVPAAAIGAVLESSFDKLGETEWLIGVFLIVFGLVLLWADNLGGRRGAETLRARDALTLGAAQALALAPGVSRSGATITAARWRGFSRDSAARVSFLMSLPITGGAVAYKMLDLVTGDGIPPGFGGAFVVGIVASAVTGWVAVWGTLHLVRTHTFKPFVVYRVVAGAAVILVAATGLR